MIREAIEGCLESLAAHGDPIPGPIEIERVTVHARDLVRGTLSAIIEASGICRDEFLRLI